MLLLEDLLPVLRMVMRASLVPTLRASSLRGLSRDCPAKTEECMAVAAAMATCDTKSDRIQGMQTRQRRRIR